VCFAVDIVFAFNTGYYKNGVLILNRKLIIIDYVKQWFLMDLISTFPYSLVIELAMHSENDSENVYQAKAP